MADEVYLAVLSIFLYSIIAALSAYYYWQLTRANRMRIMGLPVEIGRFDPAKILFFQVLFVSAMLDLPMYFGCIAKGGPKDCEWNDVSYPIFWCLHLLSLIGYTFSVVTPPVLWIDIMYNKDGLIWNSKHTVDSTKRFFQVALILFAVLMLTQIILATMYFNVADPEAFTSSNMVNATGTFLEPVSIILVSCGCLWSGIQLQLYVRKVKLDSEKEMKFLFHLNATMSIIVLTYLTRGIFVLRLFYAMPQQYEEHTRCSYFAWLVYTRWLPYIFCSLCLINEMRVSVGTSESSQRSIAGEGRRPLQSNTSSFFSVNSSFAAKSFGKLGLDDDMDLAEGNMAAASRSLLGSMQEEDSMLSSQYSAAVLERGSTTGPQSSSPHSHSDSHTDYQDMHKLHNAGDEYASHTFSFEQARLVSNPAYSASQQVSEDSGTSSVVAATAVKFVLQNTTPDGPT